MDQDPIILVGYFEGDKYPSVTIYYKDSESVNKAMEAVPQELKDKGQVYTMDDPDDKEYPYSVTFPVDMQDVSKSENVYQDLEDKYAPIINEVLEKSGMNTKDGQAGKEAVKNLVIDLTQQLLEASPYASEELNQDIEVEQTLFPNLKEKITMAYCDDSFDGALKNAKPKRDDLLNRKDDPSNDVEYKLVTGNGRELNGRVVEVNKEVSPEEQKIKDFLKEYRKENPDAGKHMPEGGMTCTDIDLDEFKQVMDRVKENMEKAEKGIGSSSSSLAISSKLNKSSGQVMG